MIFNEHRYPEKDEKICFRTYISTCTKKKEILKKLN